MVLVTGATGLIGREFIRMASPDSETIALARDISGADVGTGAEPVQWLKADLCDRSLARRLPERADVIVHLAQARGYRDFPSRATDIFEVNLAGTNRLLDYARVAGVTRFVFASTATLYQPSHTPLRESSPIACTSYYAASKRAAELLIEQYTGMMACSVMRIFTVYGAGQRDQLIANLVRCVTRGQPVTVQGHSGLPISPIYSVDVALALWHVATASVASVGQSSSTLNLGGCERLGVRELAEEIGRALDRSPTFTFEGDVDPPGWIADRTELERAFPLPRPRSFADGIRDTLAAVQPSSVSR